MNFLDPQVVKRVVGRFDLAALGRCNILGSAHTDWQSLSLTTGDSTSDVVITPKSQLLVFLMSAGTCALSLLRPAPNFLSERKLVYSSIDYLPPFLQLPIPQRSGGGRCWPTPSRQRLKESCSLQRTEKAWNKVAIARAALRFTFDLSRVSKSIVTCSIKNYSLIPRWMNIWGGGGGGGGQTTHRLNTAQE